ncbi:MAG: aminotransferase class III-fold pyridoxal phosphate-dependent enzyme [Pseudomonadota bacterium]
MDNVGQSASEMFSPTVIQRNKALVQPLIGRNDPRGARMVDGKGCVVKFEDGIEAIDAAAQDSSVILGHRHPELIDAVRAGADMVFASDTASGSPLKDAVVDDYLNIVFKKAPWIGGVRFTCTGSEAMDIGISLAQTLSGRKKLGVRPDAYHGAVGLSRDATRFAVLRGGIADPKGGFQPGATNSEIVNFPYEGELDEEALTETFKDVACVLTDCGSGHIYPDNEWFNTVGRAAKAAGAFWLHDETVTGYGRTGGGEWFHALELDVRPDMIAAGKCVTGGAAPGSILFFGEGIVDALNGRRWAAGSTFWGHPLTLMAMHKVIEIVDRDDLVAHVVERGERLGARLDEVAKLHGNVVHSVAGTGLNLTIRLHGTEEDRTNMNDGDYEPTAVMAMELARKHGVSTPAYGNMGLWIVPPFVITDEEIDRIADGLDGAFRELGASR